MILVQHEFHDLRYIEDRAQFWILLGKVSTMSPYPSNVHTQNLSEWTLQSLPSAVDCQVRVVSWNKLAL